MEKPREGKERTVRIISLALRQRIFGAIRTEGTCTLWCGDPKDAMIFRGKKHEVHEIAFHLFATELSDDVEILPCGRNRLCIGPNHLRWKWERIKISLEDRKDIVNLHNAGVSKRTLKQWYMLTSEELQLVLEDVKSK